MLGAWLEAPVGPGGSCITLASKAIAETAEPMWRLAGVHDAVCLSDGRRAGDVLPALRVGVQTLRARRREWPRLDGHVSPAAALQWLEQWAFCCEQHLDATIRIRK